MADLWMNVDANLASVPVNIMPLLDDTDFVSIETAVAYNHAGMNLTWNFSTTAGVFTSIAVTPTTAGVYDWAEHTADDGMYTIEIPATGGASANNDTEGFGWFTGVATGVLPWRGPVIGFRAAALNDALIDGGDLLDVSLTEINGNANAASRLALAAAGMVPGTVDDVGFTSTTTEFETDDITESTGAHFSGRNVLWTSGALLDQMTDIIAYGLTGGRGHFTVTTMTEAPANNDTFIIV